MSFGEPDTGMIHDVMTHNGRGRPKHNAFDRFSRYSIKKV